MSLNDSTGNAHTGFVRYLARGPFKCGNCVHMNKGKSVCVHPKMVEFNTTQARKDGYPVVDTGDCCEYQRRPGD